jgi:magnesium transporter
MPAKEETVCNNVQWVDFSQPTQGEMEELAKRYGLNNYIVRDCLDPDHLPKYDLIDDVHFLILRFFSHSFDKQIATVQDITDKIAVFYNDDFLLTLHKNEIRFMESIREKYVHAGKCSSPVEVVIKIILQSIESFNDPVMRLSERVDFYENHILLKGIAHGHIEALYYIKQQASMCNKILLLMLEPINHIIATKQNKAELQELKEQHLKMQTLYIQVLEDVNNLMNLYMSFTAQRTNDVMKVLTIFSVFFMPLTFISGIYGMNFEYMHELHSKWGYPIVLLVMMLVTVGIYMWVKKKNWL